MKLANIYPGSAFDKLELNKIILLTRALCLSQLGMAYCERISVSADPEFIRRALMQVSEFRQILDEGQAFPSDGVEDLAEILNYLEIPNSVIGEDQFQMIKVFLYHVAAVHLFFSKEEDYPTLKQLLRGESFNTAVLKSITEVISEEGTVRSGISPDLDRVRREMRSKERELDRKFSQLLLHAGEQGWLAAGSESIKNGRRVLTLLVEHKRKMRGIIHDESATGKTIFLEPEQTIELSNELFELKQEERREIYKILKELSEKIRPHVPLLRQYQKMAGIFDFIRAKARLSQQTQSEMPLLGDEQHIELRRAKHPLLLLHNKAIGRETIPLNLKLDTTQNILVISGPNAGGKSVALKTIGLLQVMMQAGFLVPVSPDSRMSVFRNIFVELGDEQSIENDLSTYSSHLLHMKYFTEKANDRTLFLLDEFGTGTDPKLGGAIAEAVLEELIRRKAFGVVTTHYSNLKLFASKHPHILNGSMLFDTEKLSPLYVLKTGQPGSSHAFEIAQKIGLSDKIVRNARKKVQVEFQEFDTLLANMETDKHLLELRERKLAQDQATLDGLISSYSMLKNDLEKNKDKMMLENKKKFLEEVEASNRKLENLVREAKEEIHNKEAQAKARTALQESREKLKTDIKQLRDKQQKGKPQRQVQVGSRVKVGEGQETGLVEEIRKSKAVVAFKTLKTLVNIADLEVVENPGGELQKRFSGIDYAGVSRDFNPTIDVRGMRADDALREVEAQLDKALLLNFHSLRILHGKGDGILRKAIRGLLNKYDFVKDVQSESPDQGGEGVTLVELS